MKDRQCNFKYVKTKGHRELTVTIDNTVINEYGPFEIRLVYKNGNSKLYSN